MGAGGGLSELSGTMLEAFWHDFRALFLSLARSVVVRLFVALLACFFFGVVACVLCNSQHGESASCSSRLERELSLPFSVIVLFC